MSFLDPIGRLCRALLRLDSPGTPGPPGGLELQEAHLEQLTVMLQWFDDAERCALKGWPDLKADVHRTFELQRLFARRSILRLNYLRKCDPARLGAAKSLSELSHLTYDGFTEEDDRAAAREVVSYGALRTEITRLSTMMPAPIDGPLEALQSDPEWHRLRDEIWRKLNAIELRAGQG